MLRWASATASHPVSIGVAPRPPIALQTKNEIRPTTPRILMIRSIVSAWRGCRLKTLTNRLYLIRNILLGRFAVIVGRVILPAAAFQAAQHRLKSVLPEPLTLALQ